MEYITLILSVVACIAALGAFCYAKKAADDEKTHHEEAKHRIGECQEKLQRLKRMLEAQENNDDYDELREKVNRLMQTMSTATDAPLRAMPTAEAPKVTPRDGFFGAPKGDAETYLFNNQYDELRDECFFRVHYAGADEAEFQPIDLVRLKSLPSIEGVIRYQGCPLREAAGFKLIKEGRAKRHHDYWIVEEPAQLETLK